MSVSVNRLLIANPTPSVAPSVYIAYHNLLAYVSCPSGPTVARGKSYNTTIAYAPEDLSTAMSARPQRTECTYIEVNYTMLGDYSSTKEPDFFLSIPSSLTSLDPAWSTCTPALYGAWDPPTTLEAATALTDPADNITPSTPAAPGGRSTTVHAPATKSSAASDPTTRTPLVASAPGAALLFGLTRTDAAKPVDPANTPNHCSTAALGCPSRDIHGMLLGNDEKPHPKDPANLIPSISLDKDGKPYTSEPSMSSLVSEPLAITEDSLMRAMSGDAELEAATHTLLPPSGSIPTLPLINGKSIARIPNGGLVLASSTIALGRQATFSGHTVSVGISDVVIDGSKYALPTHTAEKAVQFPVPFANGVFASPDRDPNDLQNIDQLLSVSQPAITISGAEISFTSPEPHASSSVLPFQAHTIDSSAGPGDLLIFTSHDGNYSTSRNGSNGSNALVFTSGTSRSPHHLQSLIVFTLATAIFAIVGMAL